MMQTEGRNLRNQTRGRLPLVLAIGVLVLATAIGARAQASDGIFGDLAERESLTNGICGLNDRLAPNGIEIAVGLTQVLQKNTGGGLGTDAGSDRYSGSYNIEFSFDLEKIFGLAGGSAYVAAEGSWSEGIDGESVGSLSGVNGDAGGSQTLFVTEAWYEQELFEGALHIRLGKMDVSGGFQCRGCDVAFDSSQYASDETSQFLNGALTGNPLIPFPDNGLGVVVYYNPCDYWYAAAGVADALANGREAGFHTAFHDDTDAFSVYETGLVPLIGSANGDLQGAYRLGLWYDTQPKARLDTGATEDDDVGVYLSFDQELYHENDSGDGQGMGVSVRYGWADDDISELDRFWSLAVQYQGALPGRDGDVVGLGAARLMTSGDAGYSAGHEQVFEAYYNIALMPWIGVSPTVQYIRNPGADKTIDSAVVAALRVQINF